MANSTQLALLKRSVAYWNVWRIAHLDVMVVLREADLQGADLHGTNLNGADLRNAILNGFGKNDLRGADLTGAAKRITEVIPLVSVYNWQDGCVRGAAGTDADIHEENHLEA